MLSSDMIEGERRVIEMPEMTDQGVRAFLAFLYCWDTSVPSQDPNVALELFRAGHKYEIPEMEKSMKEILLNTPTEKLSVDLALDLFTFATLKTGPLEDLKLKAVGVLKRLRINFIVYFFPFCNHINN